MFHGVNANRSLGESGGSFDGLDFGDVGIDEGFVGEVDAAEFESVTLRGWFQVEGNFFACVK